MAKAIGRSWVLTLLAAVTATAMPVISRGADKPEATREGAREPDKRLVAAAGLFQRGLFKLAAQEYEDFLKANPDAGDVTSARYALALCRYRLSEHARAAELISQVLNDSKFDQRDEALAVLGHCYLSTKDQAKALTAFDELVTKFPKSKHAESAAISRVQVLYVLGKAKESRTAAADFLKQYPESTQRTTAAYFLGLSHNALNEPAEAARVLADLLARYPDSPHKIDAMLLLGQSLEAQGKLDEAIAQYREMIKAAPADRKGDGRFSLGLALHKAGKYDEAAKELAGMLSDQDSAKSAYAEPARLQLGLSLLAARDYANARKILGLVVQKDAARASSAKYALAQCDIADQKYAAALTVLDDLAAAQPPPANAAQIAFQRALCLSGLEKFDEASREFARFRQQNPKDPQAAEAAYREAFCLHRLAKYDESHALCQKLAADNSAAVVKAPVAELDAENLFLLKKYDEAGKAFTALADSEKDDARRLRFTLRRGQSAYFAGDYPRAAALLAAVAADKSATRDPVLVEALFLSGDALLQQGKHTEAAEALSKYITAVGKDHPEAQYKLALAQMRSGDDAAAERTLDRMLRAGADNEWAPRALLEFAQLKVKQNKPEQALPTLDKLLAANPPPELAAPATYLRAWVDLNAKRYAEAARGFGEVIDKYPKDKLAPDAAYQCGLALKEAGKSAEALATLDSYVKSNPSGEHVAQAKQLIAAIQVRSEKPAEAAKTLTALANDPKTASAAVLYDLAWAHRGLKDNKAASADYQRLLTDYADNDLATPAAIELADLLYQDNKFAEAIPLLEKAVKSKADPKVLAAGRYRLALCYEKTNDLPKAAAAFADFADKHKTDDLAPSAHYQAGAAFAAQERFADAEKHFAAVVKDSPNHELAPIARLKLGEVQNELGNHDAAAKTFQAYLDANPKDKFAHLAQFGIGWSLESRKKYDEARQWYAKVIAGHNGPTAARAQFQTGQTYMKEGKFEEAAKALLAVEDVYASPQWSPPALYDAGQAFEQLKQPDQAKVQYGQIVQKYKEAKVADLARQRLKALGAG